MSKKNGPETNIKLKAGVIVRWRKKVLLIRELNNRTGFYRWNIIKGTFEPDKDRDIQATAIREAKEEAKASIVLKSLLGIYHLHDGDDVLTMFTFIADLKKKEFGVRQKNEQTTFRKGEDINEVRLFSLNELKSLRQNDFVGLRGYLAIQDYLNKKGVPLTLLTTLPKKK